MSQEPRVGVGWFALDDLPEPLSQAAREAVAALR